MKTFKSMVNIWETDMILCLAREIPSPQVKGSWFAPHNFGDWKTLSQLTKTLSYKFSVHTTLVLLGKICLDSYTTTCMFSVTSTITTSLTGATEPLLPRLPPLPRRRWTGWRMYTTEGWITMSPWSSFTAPFSAGWTLPSTPWTLLPTFNTNYTPTSRKFLEF